MGNVFKGNLFKRKENRLHTCLIYGVLTGGAILMVTPFYWMIITSLKTVAEANIFPPSWWPSRLVWGNYAEVLRTLPFIRYFINTAIIEILVIMGNFFSSVLVAYGFARLRFPGRETLFVVLLSTMMLPFFVRLIPLYIIFSKLGWVNTFLPLTIPAFFGGLDFSPLCIFLLRQFFRTIPQELFDAARMDGCSDLEILFRLILPISKPAIAVITIFAFQQTWNDFLGPLVFLHDESLKTVSLGLYSFVSLPGQGNQFSHLMAASAMVVMPVVIVFMLFQRYFMSSFTFSGLKG